MECFQIIKYDRLKKEAVIKMVFLVSWA